MSSFLPANSTQNFIPNDLLIPDDWKEANLILTDYIRLLVDALNTKEIAQYSENLNLTGQQFFTTGDAQKTRYVYRKVIDFGALPNASTKSVAHGMINTQNSIWTRIYATATNPGATTTTSAIPIPYVDPNTLANGIQIDVDTTNVNITTAIDYTAYTECVVILEYIQN